MEKNIELLIEKYEIQAETLLDMISDEKTNEAQREKVAACRRFVIGIINDLKNL